VKNNSKPGPVDHLVVRPKVWNYQAKPGRSSFTTEQITSNRR